MSSLNDLSQLAPRYHLKVTPLHPSYKNLCDLVPLFIRTRSNSSSGSSSSSSSSYGSILSSDQEEKKIDLVDNRPQENTHESHVSKQNHSNLSSDHQGAKLDINNKGMQLLLKMGWIEGNGLGVGQKGRKEPIPTPAQTPLLGLGKATQDAYMLSDAISKPKELQSLVIARESEEAKAKREEKVKEFQTRVSVTKGMSQIPVDETFRVDIWLILAFLCRGFAYSRYTTISQFEEHERSYAHHHAKRAVEAKQARKATGQSSDAKLEKERKREAKELERMARAAGMNLDARPSSASGKSEPSKTEGGGLKKPAAGWTKLSSAVPPSQSPEPSRDVGDASLKPSKPSGFKSSGFAPVPSSSTSGFKPIGVADVGTRPTPSSSSSGTLARGPPAFVASSSAETSFKATLEQSSESPQSTSLPNAAQPPSKFAQIAARLAARKATATSSSHVDLSTPNPGRTGSRNCSYHSEVEKMLDI
ncbi:hypothetical protein VP01_314g6 [Puccinia sorghi]|uniref:G-patch domain-containing protein n=1 Tax=Puccinia sorghi TaxID=27349 RepID=A0A0L6V0R6_9BASI|nr:hypothetical protein VP01_314g6 [Puccinia sorghi]